MLLSAVLELRLLNSLGIINEESSEPWIHPSPIFPCTLLTCVYLRIIGRGIPNLLSMDNNHTSQTHYSAVPTLDEAVRAYETSGGSLTTSSSFGCDLLAGHENLQRDRQRSMEEYIPAPAELFSFVVNGLDTPFAQSLQFMIQKTFELESQI